MKEKLKFGHIFICLFKDENDKKAHIDKLNSINSDYSRRIAIDLQDSEITMAELKEVMEYYYDDTVRLALSLSLPDNGTDNYFFPSYPNYDALLANQLSKLVQRRIAGMFKKARLNPNENVKICVLSYWYKSGLIEQELQFRIMPEMPFVVASIH